MEVFHLALPAEPVLAEAAPSDDLVGLANMAPSGYFARLVHLLLLKAYSTISLIILSRPN